jgi:LacI family transcriptional regulator
MISTEARATNVDELISCCIHKESELELFAQTGLPVVSIDHTPKRCIVDSVTTNNFAIVQRAIYHLLSIGHQTIDFVGHYHNPPRIDFDSKEMEFYWRECLAGADATGQSQYLSGNDLKAALTEMMKRPDAPTAIFFSDPGMAQAAVIALKDIGYSAPTDVSVITQGGSFSKDFKVTSIDIDWYELARLAVQRMLDLIQNRSAAGARLMHAGRFVDRGTTGVNLKPTDTAALNL